MVHKIKAVIFDMDGTIVSSEGAWQTGMIDLLRQNGYNVLTPEQKNVLDSTQGLHAHDVWELIRTNFKLVQSAEHLNAVHQAIVFKRLETEMKFIDGFQDFHAALSKRNVPTALATNATLEAVNHIDSLINLGSFFGAHRYSVTDVAGKAKPDPALFTHTSKQLKIDPAQCIVFEDSLAGFLAARAAGMKCVAIKNALNEKHLYLADVAIDSYRDAFAGISKLGELV